MRCGTIELVFARNLIYVQTTLPISFIYYKYIYSGDSKIITFSQTEHTVHAVTVEQLKTFCGYRKVLCLLVFYINYHVRQYASLQNLLNNIF